MNSNSKIKMICFIKDYLCWDDTIHENAFKFHQSYSIYPNIMLASKKTWKKIDEYANLYNSQNIRMDEDDEGFTPYGDFDEDEDYTICYEENDDDDDCIEEEDSSAEVEDVTDDEIMALASFETSNYSLEFCMDERATEDYFILVFDDDPVFDGEPYDKEEDGKKNVYRRIA
ncbi:MAG: hypothetical protein JXR90_13785 [Spirochaetes bacterium]|nr:hypothetical protein [Spirochaetota bacterium]